jgi:hypothetical protein
VPADARHRSGRNTAGSTSSAKAAPCASTEASGTPAKPKRTTAVRTAVPDTTPAL